MKRNSNRGRRNMKKEKKKKTSTTLHLPLELINQILLRLPVKSLVRFRCVCKSWCSLISDDPHFAISHFELAVAPTRRLMFMTSSAPETRSIDLVAPLNDDSASAAVKLDFLLPQSHSHLIIIGGSCRGFLFLECYPDLYMWNPSTGAHKQMPSSPIASTIVDAYFSTYLYGFGYDPSTDDYLVVVGSYDLVSVDSLTHLEFFSLRANTWKEIEGSTHLSYKNAFDGPRVGSLLNGAIHWLVYRRDIVANVIVAFDLMERRLSEISLHDDFDLDINCDLWVFGGFISLWVVGYNTVGIWVVEEHRGHSSWTKTLVLPIDHIPTRYFSPICSTECGDIVGTDGGTGLVKYNCNGQLLEYRSYPNDPHGFQVAMYTETLLSLPGGSEQA